MDPHDSQRFDDESREAELADAGRDLVRSATAQVFAPADLRARVESARRARRIPRPRIAFGGRARRIPRPRIVGGAAAACAAAAAIALLLASPGGPAAPSVVRAAELSTRPATAPAPVDDTARPWLLLTSEEGVAYPYWEDRFGWRASGVRIDRLAGREATTVFYEDARGRRLGYTILSGKRVAPPSDARRVAHGGTTLYLLKRGGRTIVTWIRAGHTCVIGAPAGVPAARLVALAAWQGGASRT
jgi:hypothetical protein